MKFLKPIFFSKYKPVKTYEYSNWNDISIQLGQEKLSVLLKETSLPVKGVVILSHPMKKEGKQFFVKMGHVEMYHQLGYHTIIFDFNGFGDSDNRGFVFDEDVYEVIQKAKELYQELPLYIHGVSFGGSQILNATLKNEKLVNGLIIESATTSNLEYYKHRGYKAQYYIISILSKISPKTNQKDVYYNLIQKLKDTPILFIYGLKDVITPKWMGEKLYEYANEPKYFEIFDTEHLTTIKEKPKKYREKISNFLDKY